MDLQGQFKSSIHGFWYVLAVIDDHSQIGWKRYLKTKDKASDEIQALIAELKISTGLKVIIIQFDDSGEFANGKLQTWLKKKGVVIEISAPDTQQQNGVAEHYNCTTHECALAMLREINMSEGFWPEAH